MDLSEVSRRGLVLLGCGKMGSALLEGWLAGGPSGAMKRGKEGALLHGVNWQGGRDSLAGRTNRPDPLGRIQAGVLAD